MKPLKLSDALPSDLQQAYDYFRHGGTEAADGFIQRYEKSIRAIEMHPQLCRMRASGWRQLAIPRSSYAIFYREAPSFWLVGAVFSTVQDPDVIQARLLIREIRDESAI